MEHILKSESEIYSTLKSFFNQSEEVYKLGVKIKNTLDLNKKILICGNGGSATQATHFASELVGRYKKNRKPYPAISLNTDNSILTCISNDYNFEEIFARQVEALCQKGDFFLGISTSGNSKNVVNAALKANSKGAITSALMGNDGGLLKDNVDFGIIINSNSTARIQEMHLIIIHLICEYIDSFEKD